MLVGRRVGGEAAAAYILVNLAAVDRVEGDFAARERADRGEPRPLPAARRQAGRGLRAQRARQPGPLQRRLRARAGAARPQPRPAAGDRRPARQPGSRSAAWRVLLARSGDPAAGRASAERARDWFAENDDLIGLSAAELSLASVALCAGDRAAGAGAPRGRRLDLRRASNRCTRRAGRWPCSRAISAEDGEPAAARGWLDRAIRHFELLGGEAGMAYCRELGR